MAHAALVGHAGQAAGARQHAQQRHLRQRHRRRAVVDQDDLVAGQREFIAAAGAGAVHRGQELQARMLRRVLEAVAGLVGELAEVDLPGVAGDTEHEDVGARAEHLLLRAGDDHRAHLRVLEADALHRVVQLDVDAQVVAVELELVAGTQAGVLVEVGRQRRDRALERQLPVTVARRVGLVVDGSGSDGGDGNSGLGHRSLLAGRTIVHSVSG